MCLYEYILLMHHTSLEKLHPYLFEFIVYVPSFQVSRRKSSLGYERQRIGYNTVLRRSVQGRVTAALGPL